MTTRHEPPGRPTGNGAPRRAWVGPVLAAIWMVFLADPVGDVLAAPTIAQRVTGIVGVAVLAVVFAWSLVRYWAGARPTPRAAVLLVTAELACVALVTLAAGQSGLAGLVFACVTVVIVAPVAAAVGAVATFVLVLVVLPHAVPGWQPTQSQALTAVLASLAMFGFRRATERNRALHRTQEEVAALAAAQERDRIARDMHDILGHSLTVVSVKAELAGRLLHSEPEPDGAPTPRAGRARDEVAEIQTLVRSALADMRGMVAGERQVTLAGELAAARSAFDAAGITADLPGAVDDVAEEHRAVFAWALREGTTNVLRHAAARHATVTLTSDALVIDDDGRGIRPGAPAASGGGGNGLAGLTERARAAGLVVETGPSPLGGLRLAVRVPDGGLPDDEAARRGGEDSA